MKGKLKGIAAIMAAVLLGGVIPILPISSASLESPFISSLLSNSSNAINSVTINSSESIGNNNEVSLFSATIKSTGTRRNDAKTKLSKSNNKFADTFSGINIAMGGKLFVYSAPTENGLDFNVNYIDDIAKKFEEEHPEWKVAVVTNATFFDNSNKTNNSGTANIGEPEDPYMEDGKLYKSWMDTSKYGRGVIGLKSDGSMVYYTQEKSDDTYFSSNGNSVKYSLTTKYSLSVLGENKNNSIYDYTLLADGSPDFTGEPIFITPTMSAKDLRGCYVYAVKCTDYRRAHTGVNNLEIGDKTYYFEGTIASMTTGTSSMKPAEGYVYVASTVKLEHLQVGVTVRGTRSFSETWAGVEYAFGYKQQILLEGTPLFEGIGENTSSSSVWAGRCDELKYADYGSNRTAIGFKEDGTPVIIAMPRKVYYTSAGAYNTETSATHYEMAWYMKSLGCVNAFIMDCGGSTRMYKKSTGSDEYVATVINPSNTNGGAPVAERAVANALILAYPSGEAENPIDEKLADPAYKPGYITATMNTPWYSGVTKLRSLAEVKNSSQDTFNTNTTLSKTNFKLAQNGAVYTFTPTTTAYASGYGAAYAYKKLGYKVEEGKKYVYCVKLHTVTKGKYTSFLFGEFPSNTDSNKMLNNFAVIGGAFSNNGDTQYSDIRVGYGRIENNTSDILDSNRNIQLYLETENSKKYSYCRIDIDGLNYTVKVKNASGTWVQIGGTYSLPSGTELIMGCASWEANTQRAMSVADPVCVDITNLSNNISEANSLNSEEYTADSWKIFDEAKIKADYSINLTYQKLIDYANTNLVTAKNGLVSRIDITNANMAEFEATSSSIYSAESWAAYEAAYHALAEAKASNNFALLDELNEAYLLAKENLQEIEMSFDINWQTISFTYYEGSQQWNPDTHKYEGNEDDGWMPKGETNVINVTNNSVIPLNVEFEFIHENGFDDLNVEFYEVNKPITDSIVISQNASKAITVKLDGAISSNIEDGTKGGTVKITVSIAE